MTKSRIRVKVEHMFRTLKYIFGFDMTRYRGVAKSHNRLCVNFALVNLYLHRKRLTHLGQVARPETPETASIHLWLLQPVLVCKGWLCGKGQPDGARKCNQDRACGGEEDGQVSI